MNYEACPDCVGDPEELIASPGENDYAIRPPCSTCGSTGLVPHGCAGNEEVC